MSKLHCVAATVSKGSVYHGRLAQRIQHLILACLVLFFIGATFVWLCLDHTPASWDDAYYLNNSLVLYDSFADGGLSTLLHQFLHAMRTKPPLIAALPIPVYWIAGRRIPAAYAIHMFENVFASPAAYAAFKRTGIWPDKTVLMLENRGAKSKGSINRLGLFQTGEVLGVEAHVKDTARFKGGRGFFAIEGSAPARQIPYTAACYACHQDHGAADTTFVQFYPTLLPIATRLGTLNPAYAAATK